MPVLQPLPRHTLRWGEFVPSEVASEACAAVAVTAPQDGNDSLSEGGSVDSGSGPQGGRAGADLYDVVQVRIRDGARKGICEK